MLKFKQFENNQEETYSDEYVSSHIIDLTPNESDIPDYFIEKLIKGRTFIRKDVNIQSILQSDSSFKEYFDSGEDRYEDEEVSHNDLYFPVVLVDGQLLDGYSRCSTLLRNGEEFVTAYVAI